MIESQGCLYCKLTQEGRKEMKSEKGIISDIFIEQLTYTPKCYGLTLRIVNHGIFYDRIKINYCPMCGMKLNDEITDSIIVDSINVDDPVIQNHFIPDNLDLINNHEESKDSKGWTVTLSMNKEDNSVLK